MSDLDPKRRTDVVRDATSTVVGDSADGPKPARVGPAPVAKNGKEGPPKSHSADDQQAEEDSRKDVTSRLSTGS